LRDAPYAGLFVVFYEAVKYEAASVVRPSTPLVSAALHGGSAAAAGTIATLATHPFDVIKVLSCSSRDRAHLHCPTDKDASSQ